MKLIISVDDEYYSLFKYADAPLTSSLTFADTVSKQKMLDMLKTGVPYVEKTGHWIDGFCSACGGSGLCDGWGNDVDSAYCPKCGARMIRENK
jgi:hypothetical protein